MKLKNLAAFLAVMALAVIGFVASSATGATQAGPTMTLVSSEVIPTKVIGAKASAKSVATGKVTILGYVKAKGLSKHEKSHSRTMKIGAGTSVPVYWNSGRASNGGLYWFRDTRTITAYLVGGSWRKGPCGNYLRFTAPRSHVVKGRVILVRSLAKVKLVLTARAEVYVTAYCGRAFGKGTASVTVTLSAFIRSRGSVNSRISGKALAKASADASAELVCVETPPSTTTTTPGTTVTVPTTTTTTTTTPTQPPSVSNVTSPEEIYADGETYPNICADISGKNGNSLTIVFSANYGSFPSSTFTFTSQGVDRRCTTYKAPNDGTAVGHSDQIKVTVHDNATGLDGQPAFSLLFPILAPPVNP